MTPYKIKNKIYEIRSYIASDWPSVEERRNLYDELEKLERQLKEFIDEENSKDKS